MFWFTCFSFTAIFLAMHFGLHDLIIIVLFALTILSAVYNQGRVKTFLDTKHLQLLGDWSFSIYMIHVLIIYLYWIIDIKANPEFFADLMLFLSMEPDYGKGLVRLFVLLTSTLVLSAITYRYVEVPLRNYLKNKIKTV